jgi:hypothetical protein
VSQNSGRRFIEKQGLPLRRVGVALLVPPCIMLGLLVWQVVLGHPWGVHPMSNARVIGWTIFLWVVYLRLITVRLVTEVRDQTLIVALRGLWRTRRIALADIQSVETVTFDPERDYGGYGIRSNREGKAYLAKGHQGVRLKLASGAVVVVGSERSKELARFLRVIDS